MFLATQFAAIGGINFTNDTQTADVSLSKLRVNPSFWEMLNDTEKNFVIDHEMMHLVLKHHSRFALGVDHEVARIATDLAINSLLVEQYCGNLNPREVIPYIYAIAYFPEHFGFPKTQTTDFYIELIKKNPTWEEVASSYKTFGGRLGKDNSLAESLCSEYKRDMTDFSAKVMHMISEENPKFSELMKELTGNSAPLNTFSKIERWTYNRRTPWSNLPAEVWSEGLTRVRKNRIGLFLDYSGSCSNMSRDFEKVAATIPARLFQITKFKFASRCAKFDSPDSIGDGTCFDSIIEHEKDFDQIWVFSDGEGFISQVNYPKRWVWFLGGSFFTTGYIADQNFRIINLNKFVDV